MKQAKLIYNPRAGGPGGVKLQELMNLLKENGVDATYQVTGSESELDAILEDPPQMVIAAGGDGTIRGVVKRIIDKEVPLAIIPLGTANNFARSLKINGNPLELVRHITDFTPRKIDIGKIIAPWGEDIFIEGVGFGFFADLLEKYRPETDKKIGRALNVLFDTITNIRTYKSEIMVDGESIKGDYLLVEVLNSKSVGPRLAFAKGSKINDGRLNVIRIVKSENLFNVALGLFSENLESLDGVKRIRAKEVRFQWNGFPVHVDDEIYPDVNEKINYWYATNAKELINDEIKESREIIVTIKERKLKVLLP